MAGEPLIETHGLTKSYEAQVAVDGIDLTVRPGEVFGLLGPNGAGKTTTILMLLGLTEPDSGTVRVCGLDPARQPLAVKRQVGYMPDAPGFYDDLTGRQNMRFTARLNELTAEEAERRIGHLLGQVGLTDAADRPVGTYSRGMRQRLAIADALVKEPRVVILDEPTVGIDPEGVIEMQGLISRLARDDERAVLLSSHMLNQVQQVCDRMAIFVGGKVVAEGTADELAGGVDGGQTVFELVVAGPPEQVESVIRDAVTDAAPQRVGPNRWQVTLPTGDVTELLRALVGADLSVRQLRDLGSDLDQIYHRYFAGV